MNEPWSEAAIASLFEPYANARAILVAVSGGPDSMALLWLASRWSKGDGKPRIEAATVDHGLRADSRDEALSVQHVAASLGVPHHVLEWAGPKPSTRIQERARDARYALLEGCAASIEADVLMTAHHADDQAETILFRLQRGSGFAGLAGMSRERRRGSIIHARPLLHIPKDELVSICGHADLPYVTDPSNVDPRYARARLRTLMPQLAAAGLDRPNLLRLGKRAARMDEAVKAYVDMVLRGLKPESRDGFFRVSLATQANAPVELLLRILLGQIQKLGPEDRILRLDRAESLAERLAEGLRKGTAVRATLGGALVALDASGVLTLLRESPRSVRLAPGKVHTNRII